MKEYGVLKLPSRKLGLGDPCYLTKTYAEELSVNGIEEIPGEILVRDVPGDAKVFIEDCKHCTGRTGKVHLVFSDGFHLQSKIGREETYLGVDSGQMAYYDAVHLGENWIEEDYQIVSRYRHKTSGKILQYLVDFPHYMSPIASEDGKNMNQLNETGEWELLPYDGPLNISYNGLSHCHDDNEIGQIGNVGDHIVVSSSGWGDGRYPVIVRYNLDGSIACITLDFDGDDDEEEYEEDEYEEDEE